MPDWTPFAPVQVQITTTERGEKILRNKIALQARGDTLLDRLENWVSATPDQDYLCERDGASWRKLTYGAVWEQLNRYAAHLLTLGLSPQRPLLVLAPNSIGHALVVFAAMRIGVPATIVSMAYASAGAQTERLRRVIELMTPGAIYSEGGEAARSALQLSAGLPVFDLAGLAGMDRASPDAVRSAARNVNVDTIAKFLFTSGSNGPPKAVPNTHRMMCSNMDGVAQVWPFLREKPPVLLDWLPWSHTFGGNCCFNTALNFGGTFYIDGGKPLPALIGRTIENLHLIQPSIYFNVPAGFDALLPHLDGDLPLAHRFLGGLSFIFNAGAALPSSTRANLMRLAEKAGVTVPPIIGAWGSTETAPFSTVVYFPTPHAHNLGVPMPGVDIKLVPNEEFDELRVRGPNVMAGYWRNPEATQAAFDEDGFFKMGDSGKLAERTDAGQGILFVGRISENFKLGTGTWVEVNKLRLEIIAAAAPMIRDVVVCGENSDELGLLIFPAGQPVSDGIEADIRARITAYNQAQIGASTRIGRFVLLPEPPQLDLGEITDKGYLNQRLLLRTRAGDVERLYSPDTPSLRS